MPTPEEILKQFRDTQNAVKTTDGVQTEVMARKLQALMSEQDPAKSAQMGYDLLRDHSDSAMGTAVCQCLLNKPDGVKLATNVGRNIAKAEISKVTESNGVESFLRGNGSPSTFSKEFITQTSPNYISSIKQSAQQLAQKHGIDTLAQKSEPERLQTMIDLSKDMKSLASNTDNLSPESKQYLSALNAGVQDDVGFAQRFSGSANVSLEQAQATQQRLGEIAINNSAALRFVMSDITTNPELTKNQYWRTCANVAQNSFNLNGKDSLNEKASSQRYEQITGKMPPSLVDEAYTTAQGKCTEINKQIKEAKEQNLDTQGLEDQKLVLDQEFKVQEGLLMDRNNNHINEVTRPLAVGVHTVDSRQEVSDMMTRLKETERPEALGLDFQGEHQKTSDQRGLDNEKLTKEVKVDIESQKLAQATKPFDDHIKQLEERKQQLKQNPTLKDKIKGFFNHGLQGVKGEIAKIDKEITATKTAIDDVKKGVTMDDRREHVELMKQGMRANSNEIDQGKSQLVATRLDESFGSFTSNPISEEQIDKLETKIDTQKEMHTKLKAEEKVLSVREKLGIDNSPAKVQAPKVSQSVK